MPKENMNIDYNTIITELKNKIFALSDGNIEKICVFGAGQRGIKLLNDLEARCIDIDCFCDNDEAKIGTVICGIPVISCSELKKYAGRTLIIVSAEKSEDIISQVKQLGFSSVVKYSDIVNLYCTIPPIKWLKEFDEIIDFSDDNVIKLINIFKKTIMDICKYYEGNNDVNRIDK